jgi:hypothetical protein
MRRRLTDAIFASATTLCLTTNAFGQGSSPDLGTQKLYDQATSAMDSGDYASACPKLEEVNRLVPDGVGARLTLAECYEGADKLASALHQYMIAEAAAAHVAQADRRAKALHKVKDLTGRVATLRIQLPATANAGVSVLLDGNSIPESDWATAVPVDKGAHRVEITAPGKHRFDEALVIAKDGETRELKVMFEPSVPTPAATAMAPSRSWQLPTGVAIASLGAVAAGVGVGFGVAALGRKNAASQDCNATLACTSAGMTLRQQGRTFANASTALLVIGGLSAGTGIVLAATSPSRRHQENGPTTALIVGPLSLGIRGEID